MLNPVPSPQPLPPPALNPSRRRGGQPGNQNARKQGIYSLHQPGRLSHIPSEIKRLNSALNLGALSPQLAHDRVVELETELQECKPLSSREALAIDRLFIKLCKVSISAANAALPSDIRERALANIAHDPFSHFERWYRDQGITRDADSFFFVSKLSVHNSPLPPMHPALATNLTEDQWAVLEPLIPPAPRQACSMGQPPVIIAANRWDFSRYSPHGDFADFLVMCEYERILAKLPAPHASLQSPVSSARRRGRPPSRRPSPRILLDAILWKLATGRTWDELPLGFPPMHLCRKYYRRIFLSGRFYTLMLALYNHIRLEMVVDPCLLLQEGLFTTTPSQHVALHPDAPPTSANYTALLFMQMARSAYTYFERLHKRKDPFYPLLPVFRGDASLSTGWLPRAEPPHFEPEFIPLEQSLLGIRYRKAERDRKAFDRELASRLQHPLNPAAEWEKMRRLMSQAGDDQEDDE